MQHIYYLSSTFIALWILYAIVLLISAFLTWAFRFKLGKGILWRATTISVISLFLIAVLLTLVLYILLAFFGQDAVQYFPAIIMILLPVLAVMLIAFSQKEQKETKKKK